MSNDDPFELQRFVNAQNGVIEDALTELRAGRKRTHWMWFVFPQLRGLGHSWMAERFGIGGAAEAVAYLAHPVLGPRLRECTGALLAHGSIDPEAVFGAVDALKLRSSLTLFDFVAPDDLFGEALGHCCDGEGCGFTLDRLGADPTD